MRWAVVLAGCGRIGFSPMGDGDASVVDGSGPADTLRDGPPPNLATVTFGERITSTVRGVTTDTFISNEAGEPTLNYGITDELRSEQDVGERILLRFDLVAIPMNAQVFSATLAVEVLQANALATWTLHPVLEVWTEGNLDGTVGVANFTQRQLGDLWTTAGAGSPGSSSATAIGSKSPAALGQLEIPLDRTAVQAWVATPANNFGIVILNNNGESARMASSEHPTAAIRPQLTVSYVP